MVAARVGASFLLALILCISIPALVLVLGAAADGGKSDFSFFLVVLIGGVIPTMVIGGLLWLPVLLAVRSGPVELRFLAVLLSAAVGGAWLLLLDLWTLRQSGLDWKGFASTGLFMIWFSAFFLWIDRRWGEPPGRVVALAFVLLALSAALIGLLLFNAMWPHGFPPAG